MIALISSRIRFDNGERAPDKQTSPVGWWKKSWHAVAEWLMEPIPFPGQWPTCNSSPHRYNGDNQAMNSSSKKSLADVQ